ncbi:DUF5709 domain-containing protein [Pseudonocardia sp. H11422]|uniref:DUF5709 domain-containing protein n=1 Tax=Pseudonocardia sp. H11422 TaxID=2835866 RepID=UPI001BDC5FA1|nr:DUF5709 domain-containing protein [Pseudonocardia sp. H11422]
MAQRDFEDQPEAPDLAETMQLDTDETLTGPHGSDPLDAGYVPPDRPYGLDEDGVTGAAQREGESLDDRLRRERPDTAEPADTSRSGRLAAAEDGATGETTVDTDAVDVGIDGGAASSEEAAMHDMEAGIEPVVDESPMEDPEVADSLDTGAPAERAERDAERDAAADVDPVAGRDRDHRAGGAGGPDAAAGIDAAPDAAGAAAPASGRVDAGPDGAL